MRLFSLFFLAAFAAFMSIAHASQSIPDQYPQSVLYSKPVEVIPHVFAAIGATAPPGYANSGHNNNLSFIVTGEGVVVINAGSSYLLAKALHDEIKKVTDQPVKLVINENGQGHAMLGNSYWHKLGVEILAHEGAAEEFKERGFDVLDRMKSYNKEKAEGTSVQGPTETLSELKTITMGDFTIEVRWLGPSHSPGDIAVWLPKQKLVFSGDMAFHERMLPIFESSGTAEWLESWKNFEALGALYVIPGHGHPTNMAQVRRYTRDYLVYLRGKVGELIESGGSLQDSYDIDQSAYAHLDTFKELAKRNASRVFEQMEFE